MPLNRRTVVSAQPFVPHRKIKKSNPALLRSVCLSQKTQSHEPIVVQCSQRLSHTVCVLWAPTGTNSKKKCILSSHVCVCQVELDCDYRAVSFFSVFPFQFLVNSASSGRQSNRSGLAFSKIASKNTANPPQFDGRRNQIQKKKKKEEINLCETRHIEKQKKEAKKKKRKKNRCV